jgi:hypothetical protein
VASEIPNSDLQRVVVTHVAYESQQALDTAIKDRVASAAHISPYGIAEMQRHIAYDRLLTRVFLHDPGGWVLNGGTGLLTRIPGVVRPTADVDIFRDMSTPDIVGDLATAGDNDLEDFFSFDIEKVMDLTGGTSGVRCRVVAYLGEKAFDSFSIDVVTTTVMTREPDILEPLLPIDIDGLTTVPYRTYPIVDHIADKLAAMVSFYANGAPSSRYRDLVDLVLIATTQTVRAEELATALDSEFTSRELDMPTRVRLPSDEWVNGYTAEAQNAPGFEILDVEDALPIVRALLEPALAGTAYGVWDPHRLAWVD